MKALAKTLFAAIAVIGIIIVGVSIWAGQKIAETPPQAAAPTETKSAYARIQEACQREVGQQGPDAVQRCEAEILGDQIERNQEAQAATEDEAIARARESLN